MAVTTETRVGIFFLVGIAILGLITFKVENLGEVFKRKYEMYTRFPHASGMNVGDAVSIAGVKVGEIKEVTLKDDSVVIVLNIEARARVRRGATATIAWGGLLGNRYIDITLGDPKEPFLPAGSDIPTIPGIELTQVIKKVDAAASQLQEMLKGSDAGPKLSRLLDNLLKISEDIRDQKGTIGKLIGSDELYKKAVDIADDLKGTAARLNKLISDNDKRIGNIIENLDAAAPDVRAAIATIRRIAEQVDKGNGLLPQLLRDEQMYKDFKSALSRVSSIADRVEDVAKRVQEGRGLFYKLTQDEQWAKDFDKMSKDLSTALESFKNIAVRLDTGDSTLARLTRDKDLYVDVKKLLDDFRETLRTSREQVPVGTFAAVLISSF
jgi:phospholipid/cholesterol/gamma-HCH transport system substrate-binding protein